MGLVLRRGNVLNFHTINGWLEKKIDQAPQSWRGNEARRTIEEVMQRSTQAAQSGISITDSVANIDFRRPNQSDNRNSFAGVLNEKLSDNTQQTREDLQSMIKSTKSLIPEQFDGWNISE
jgi:hypothetical protein